jgi:H/ACA ribonucleoprotein complex non-core subunit NAF1
MVYGPEAELDSDFEEVESEDDEEVFKFGDGVNLRQMAMEMMEDDEPAPSGPILSANEAPLPPVSQPPIVKLPEGEKLNLAGDVVSWMKDKKAEAWIVKVAAQDAEAVPMETQSTEPPLAIEKLPETEVTTIVDQDTTAPLDEEDEVELVTSAVTDEDDVVEPNTDTTAEPTVDALPPTNIPTPAEIPKLHSSGTVVIRAMQDLSSTGEGGWLEEGSVVCFADGRVLGTVSHKLCVELTKGLRNIWTIDIAILPDSTSPSSSSLPDR